MGSARNSGNESKVPSKRKEEDADNNVQRESNVDFAQVRSLFFDLEQMDIFNGEPKYFKYQVEGMDEYEQEKEKNIEKYLSLSSRDQKKVLRDIGELVSEYRKKLRTCIHNLM